MEKLMFLVLMSVIGFSAQAAEIFCRFEPDAAPISYLEMSVEDKIGFTLTQWPEKRADLREVLVQDLKGGGFNLVIFGDVVLITTKYTGSASLPQEQNQYIYPFEAYWNPKVPGAPLKEAKRGVCWTDRLQKRDRNRFRDGG